MNTNTHTDEETTGAAHNAGRIEIPEIVIPKTIGEALTARRKLLSSMRKADELLHIVSKQRRNPRTDEPMVEEQYQKWRAKQLDTIQTLLYRCRALDEWLYLAYQDWYHRKVELNDSEHLDHERRALNKAFWLMKFFTLKAVGAPPFVHREHFSMFERSLLSAIRVYISARKSDLSQTEKS